MLNYTASYVHSMQLSCDCIKLANSLLDAYSSSLVSKVQESPRTVQKMLQLLRDGRFLDARSKVSRGHFVTYNEPLDTFATVEMALSRGSNGAFHGKARIPLN